MLDTINKEKDEILIKKKIKNRIPKIKLKEDYKKKENMISIASDNLRIKQKLETIKRRKSPNIVNCKIYSNREKILEEHFKTLKQKNENYQIRLNNMFFNKKKR
jgi:hypothetical protein